MSPCLQLAWHMLFKVSLSPPLILLFCPPSPLQATLIVTDIESSTVGFLVTAGDQSCNHSLDTLLPRLFDGRNSAQPHF